MRKTIYKIGDRKVTTKFLFRKMIINNEMRWLETASWVEELIHIDQKQNESPVEAAYNAVLNNNLEVPVWKPVFWCDSDHRIVKG